MMKPTIFQKVDKSATCICICDDGIRTTYIQLMAGCGVFVMQDMSAQFAELWVGWLPRNVSLMANIYLRSVEAEIEMCDEAREILQAMTQGGYDEQRH
jgi:hypothetical protein